MIYEYFKVDDFKCSCCNVNMFKKEHIIVLDNLRVLYGKPMIVNSGYRCEKHNKEVGGKIDSEHPEGDGVDIKVENSNDRFELLFNAINIGIKRIGIAKTFIHLGFSKTKTQEVLWLY